MKIRIETRCSRGTCRPEQYVVDNVGEMLNVIAGLVRELIPGESIEFCIDDKVIASWMCPA